MNVPEVKKGELELYFHIPFCVRKCSYCDFLSAPADEETKRNYMKALLAETAGMGTIGWLLYLSEEELLP